MKKCTVHDVKPQSRQSIEECPYCADEACYDWQQHLANARDVLAAKKSGKRGECALKCATGGTAYLDAQRLAGLSSATARSEASEQVCAGSEQDNLSVSDNETYSSSKKSDSRPNWQRGVRKNARNTFRAQKDQESKGGVWIHNLRWQNVLESTGLEGAHALALQARALGEHEMEVLTIQEKLARVRIVNEECQDGRIEEDLARLEECHVTYVEGRRVCGFCGKTADEKHLLSAQHKINMMEHRRINAMIGEATKGSTRRFNTHNGGSLCTCLPTQANLFEFWGEGLDQLGFVAAMKHAETGKIFLTQGKKKKTIEITPEQVQVPRVGIVAYSGKGKYDGNKFAWFDLLPPRRSRRHGGVPTVGSFGQWRELVASSCVRGAISGQYWPDGRRRQEESRGGMCLPVTRGPPHGVVARYR